MARAAYHARLRTSTGSAPSGTRTPWSATAQSTRRSGRRRVELLEDRPRAVGGPGAGVRREQREPVVDRPGRGGVLLEQRAAGPTGRARRRPAAARAGAAAGPAARAAPGPGRRRCGRRAGWSPRARPGSAGRRRPGPRTTRGARCRWVRRPGRAPTGRARAGRPPRSGRPTTLTSASTRWPPCTRARENGPPAAPLSTRRSVTVTASTCGPGPGVRRGDGSSPASTETPCSVSKVARCGPHARSSPAEPRGSRSVTRVVAVAPAGGDGDLEAPAPGPGNGQGVHRDLQQPGVVVLVGLPRPAGDGGVAAGAYVERDPARRSRRRGRRRARAGGRRSRPTGGRRRRSGAAGRPARGRAAGRPRRWAGSPARTRGRRRPPARRAPRTPGRRPHGWAPARR